MSSVMSKYQSLSEHLAANPADEWRASFSELEAVLGFPLPKAARAGRAWWANDPERRHSRAWTTQGWEVGEVDHAAGHVVFRRGAASGLALAKAARREPLDEADPVEPHAGGAIRPPVMRKAAEVAARSPAGRLLRALALAAAAAVVAGLGAALVRRRAGR